jgi:hypothetical protein
MAPLARRFGVARTVQTLSESWAPVQPLHGLSQAASLVSLKVHSATPFLNIFAAPLSPGRRCRLASGEYAAHRLR